MEPKQKLYTSIVAFRETVRAAAAESGSVSTASVEREFLAQFNNLSEYFNREGYPIQLPLYDEYDVQSASAILAQLNMAVKILEADDLVEGFDNPGLEFSETVEANLGKAVVVSEKAVTSKPRIFIGCSSEGIAVAKIVQMQLEATATPVIWSQGVFGLSHGTLETLVAKCREFDYAVLILTPDDLTVKRGNQGKEPRDNVLFELGLFMGALGRDRTFVASRANVSLPSDLAGVTVANFDYDPSNLDQVASLGPLTTQLEIAMGVL
ncbi:nucleotide-binding protein [Streptomyces sp. NPDC008159]|uniref:nucleotide-binding protein n=1 Tax=Streptomyces sp. NPDC008159 TaxID=3364817 RepID=UPI0036E7979A